MEFVHEITAYLENKPGRLAKICSALAHEKVNIQALSVMDTTERSVLRFVTDDRRADPQGAHLAGHRVRGLRGPGRRDGEPPRGPRPGPGDARRGAHQRRVRLRRPSARSPGKSLGIFHTSNPKRALKVLTDPAPTASTASPTAARSTRAEAESEGVGVDRLASSVVRAGGTRGTHGRGGVRRARPFGEFAAGEAVVDGAQSRRLGRDPIVIVRTGSRPGLRPSGKELCRASKPSHPQTDQDACSTGFESASNLRVVSTRSETVPRPISGTEKP